MEKDLKKEEEDGKEVDSEDYLGYNEEGVE